MASNGDTLRAEDTENSLLKIKRQLASASGRIFYRVHFLSDPKRYDLRRWNERWVILDPTTGRMEYNGLPKYDGCCFYIGTPQRKDYFLCAETPGAARAWVSTLQATQLVLKAHKEAVNSLSGNGSAKLGTVATVVAAANSTAQESSKEIEAAMQISLRNTLGVMKIKLTDRPMDDFPIMKVNIDIESCTIFS